MLFLKNVPGLGDVISVTKCAQDCQNNPNEYQCTEDVVTCTYDWFDIKCWFNGCETKISCVDGYYFTDPVSMACRYYWLGSPVKCVEGKGCVTCGSAGSTQQAQAAPAGVCQTMGSEGATCSGSNTTISIPHDPNAKYGPEGDLLPGQAITYTVTYENEGAGQAYGVFVLDQLDEDLDLGSVSVQGGGQLITQSGILIWQIGELAPKGQTGSSGVVTFTARLKEGLPSGTVVTNQATVYFPSVGEETPTNMVVNVVQPVVALPQVVETTYGQPVDITLQGLEVSGLPLTFNVVTSPRRGEVSGEGANLTYTPAADFVGGDGFTFKASNGIMESRASSVRVIVNPSSADATPPTVRWTYPSNGAENVGISASPVLTDTEGSAYAPALIVQFSEPVSPTTVTTDTLRLSAAGGSRLAASVWYDGTLDRAIIVPRERLVSRAQYTGTVTQGVEDASGNSLASEYTWSFQTGEAAVQQWWSHLPILMK
jgi:fimbrial isopeptide formation D2 family protein